MKIFEPYGIFMVSTKFLPKLRVNMVCIAGVVEL
jgi:hypothetical protein